MPQSPRVIIPRHNKYPSSSQYGPLIIETFQRTLIGVGSAQAACIGMAIVSIESAFDPLARNLGPGDDARGGSWGLCQVSLKTARALGYQGVAEGLLDPQVNCTFAARLVATFPDPIDKDGRVSIKEIACRYNSGKPMAKAPASTLRYADKVGKAFMYWQAVLMGSRSL